MDDQQKLAWCMFYCAIMGWQFHPGTKERLTIEEAAGIADGMLENYISREQQLWAGWQQRK